MNTPPLLLDWIIFLRRQNCRKKRLFVLTVTRSLLFYTLVSFQNEKARLVNYHCRRVPHGFRFIIESMSPYIYFSLCSTTQDYHCRRVPHGSHFIIESMSPYTCFFFFFVTHIYISPYTQDIHHWKWMLKRSFFNRKKRRRYFTIQRKEIWVKILFMWVPRKWSRGYSECHSHAHADAYTVSKLLYQFS